MAGVSTERLRNVVLLSHTGAGKTTLGEALLFTAGVISRMGRVEDGNTTADYEPEAVRRRSSTQLAVLPLPWKDHKVTLLDTPGYFDFLGEVYAALQVADGAVLVVSATAGVEVGTEMLWREVRARGLPCLLFLNKMDRENADFEGALSALQEHIGRHCVPLQVPLGQASSFKGVLPLLPTPAEVPPEARDLYEKYRDRLMEAAAEADDDLATKYLEGEALSDEEVAQALTRGVREGKVVPLLVGSASQNIGTGELLDALLFLLPSPVERPPLMAAVPGGDGTVEVRADPSAPLAAQVFKTTADPYVGRLSLLRVFQGTLPANSEAFNPSKGQEERIGQLFVMRGKNQESVPALSAGEIGAVPKLAVTATGDTLCARDHSLLLPPLSFPSPTFTLAVHPKTKADTDKLAIALNRLAEEDPSLRFTREPDTGEALLSGLGDAHLEVAVQRAQRKFNVNLLLSTPKVPYKETVTATTSVEHKYKQQTGGHGHYAHVFLRLEPLPRGQGLEFAEEIVGGRVPKEFIPYVEKGVRRAAQEGVLAGFPMVDVKVVLYDGSYHVVDSAGIDFDTAGYWGLKKGAQQAGPVLLEPIMRLEVTAPDSFTGDIMGDINGKRGRILGMNPLGNGLTKIEALVPLAEAQRYTLDLRSLTQGRGSFRMEFDHYEEVPPHLAQRVIEQAKQEREAARER